MASRATGSRNLQGAVLIQLLILLFGSCRTLTTNSSVAVDVGT